MNKKKAAKPVKRVKKEGEEDEKFKPPEEEEEEVGKEEEEDPEYEEEEEEDKEVITLADLKKLKKEMHRDIVRDLLKKVQAGRTVNRPKINKQKITERKGIDMKKMREDVQAGKASELIRS